MSKPTRSALVTGITGQDGAYLARLLLSKGYAVHGMRRRSSSIHSPRVDAIYQDPHVEDRHFSMHYGDLTDSSSLIRIMQEVQPDEVYNLAAQSHVAVSFEVPEYTANSDAVGTLRVLEAIRILGLTKKTRFYQASTSELYGSSPAPQSETTPFRPRSPYAAAKLYGYWITVNYREAYGIHASNGILFNHESPMRGETFVTRKITRGVAAIACDEEAPVIFLGNLDSLRDWGHAKDYVRGMWEIVQHTEPGDYVLATGVAYTVREFVDKSFKAAGIDVKWEGKGLEETGTCAKTGRVLVKVDPRYFRPTEVDHLCGDRSKAKAVLGWEPEIDLDGLVQDMVQHDIKIYRRLGKQTSEYLDI